MMFRLLAINTVFLIFFALRKAKGAHRLNPMTVLQVQAFLILANCLILFQRDVQNFLDRFI